MVTAAPNVEETLASVLRTGARLRFQGRTLRLVQVDFCADMMIRLALHADDTGTKMTIWRAPSDILLAVMP